jgi:hypothetical protein
MGRNMEKEQLVGDQLLNLMDVLEKTWEQAANTHPGMKMYLYRPHPRPSALSQTCC